MNKTPLNEYQHRSRSTGAEFVIVAVLLANYMLDPMVSAGIAAVALFFWVSEQGLTLPRLAVSLAAIPFGLVVLGIAMGVDRSLYDVGKDTWYFAMPAFGLAFGVLAARGATSPRAIVLGFLIGGTLLSTLFLIAIAVSLEIVGATSVDAIRSEVGAGYFPTVLALLVLLTFQSRLASSQIAVYGPVVVAAWAINSLALLLSFSRTMWFAFLIGLIIHFRVFDPRRVLWWVLVAGIGAAVVALPLSGAGSEDDLLLSIIGKVTRSLDEMIPRFYESESDININWRGYESLMGLQTYLSGSASELILGQGFGALVDLGLSIKLGDGDFRYIPILHNGYIYLLVKVGALGLLSYFVWLYKIFELARTGGRSEIQFAMQAGRLAQVLVLVILFTTLVVSGVFNKYDALPLMTLVGAMLTFATRGSRPSGLWIPASSTEMTKLQARD